MGRHHRAYVRQADDLIPTEARGKWDLREMRIISMMCPALILAGCTFLNDAPPKVIYQSSDTISVEYSDDGLMRVSNRQEAMEMIERHCGGPYRIVGGSGGVLTPSAFDRAVKSKRLSAKANLWRILTSTGATGTMISQPYFHFKSIRGNNHPTNNG